MARERRKQPPPIRSPGSRRKTPPIAAVALPYTMTGVARLQATIDAVRYCVRRGIPGAFAECGVWRGGSILAMILTLQSIGSDDRDIYLYDTFEGMTAPTEHDVSPRPSGARHVGGRRGERGEALGRALLTRRLRRGNGPRNRPFDWLPA